MALAFLFLMVLGAPVVYIAVRWATLEKRWGAGLAALSAWAWLWGVMLVFGAVS